MDDIPTSRKIKRPQVAVCSHRVEVIEDVPMRVVILECGHIIIRAPEWALRKTYECWECWNLIQKACGGRL